MDRRAEAESIFTESEKLISLLYECVPMINKLDRPIYLTETRQMAELVNAEFIMAYTHKSLQKEYYRSMATHFYVVMIRVRRIANWGLLVKPNKTRHKTPEGMANELTDCIGLLDTAIIKWGHTVLRGRSGGA